MKTYTIDPERWCRDKLEDDDGNRCALGFINHALTGEAIHTAAIRIFGVSGFSTWSDVSRINNDSEPMDQDKIDRLNAMFEERGLEIRFALKSKVPDEAPLFPEACKGLDTKNSEIYARLAKEEVARV